LELCPANGLVSRDRVALLELAGQLVGAPTAPPGMKLLKGEKKWTI
jgi:hypothetical protein